MVNNNNKVATSQTTTTVYNPTVNVKNANSQCANMVAFINANGGMGKWALQLNSQALNKGALFGGLVGGSLGGLGKTVSIVVPKIKNSKLVGMGVEKIDNFSLEGFEYKEERV